MALAALVPADRHGRDRHRLHSYNEVLPLMLARYCGPGLLGLGITALIAGFMSGMAGNVSAFTTVWTYDIYARPHQQERHRTRTTSAMGRWCHHHRRARQYRHGLPGDAVPQHHGLCAGALQLLHRAAVRHCDSRHALEARHPGRRFWGLLAGTVSSIGMWAWVKLDPAALRYVALSPMRRIMAENMYRALWSLDDLRDRDGRRQL